MTLRYDGYFCDSNTHDFQKCQYFTTEPTRKSFILKRLLKDQHTEVVDHVNTLIETKRSFPKL